MTEQVRSAVLSNYAEVARSVGLDPHEMVRAAGLSPSCLSEPDLKVPTRKIRQLLEDSAALSGTENFGLRMAETRRLSILGPLGVLARDAPTVRGLLEIIMQHMRLHNESLFLHIEDSAGIATIRQNLVLKERGAMRQSVELSLGAVLRVMRIFLRDEWTPTRVCLVHQSPVDLSLHRKIFGASLDFGAEFDGILCRSSDLDTTIAASDPVMAGYARRLLERSTALPGKSVQRDVQQLILILLPSGRCTIDNVARHLNVDRRTIHRHLANDGTTFSELLNKTREDLSDRYLGLNNRTMAEISHLLGFSVPAAYSRWHQSQYGQAPSARRSSLLAADGNVVQPAR